MIVTLKLESGAHVIYTEAEAFRAYDQCLLAGILNTFNPTRRMRVEELSEPVVAWKVDDNAWRPL